MLPEALDRVASAWTSLQAVIDHVEVTLNVAAAQATAIAANAVPGVSDSLLTVPERRRRRRSIARSRSYAEQRRLAKRYQSRRPEIDWERVAVAFAPFTPVRTSIETPGAVLSSAAIGPAEVPGSTELLGSVATGHYGANFSGAVYAPGPPVYYQVLTRGNHRAAYELCPGLYAEKPEDSSQYDCSAPMVVKLVGPDNPLLARLRVSV